MGLSYGRSAPLSLKKGELSVGVICCLINMISCFDNFNIHQNERLCCKVSSLSRALFFCRVYGQPVYSRKGFRVVLRGTRQAILEPARLAFPSGLEPAVSANGDSVLDCAESGPRKNEVRTAIAFFALQLFLNMSWSAAFFGLQNPLAGLLVIILLWLAIVMTIVRFRAVSATAGYLLVPYLMWVSFAAFLNFTIWQLNP